MKTAEIREMPSEEIGRELAEKRRALFNLRFQRETEQLARPAEIHKLKCDVARLLTVLRERERAEGAAAEGTGAEGAAVEPNAAEASPATEA